MGIFTFAAWYVGNLLFTFQGVISSEEYYKPEYFTLIPLFAHAVTFHRMTQYECACLTDCVQFIAFLMPSALAV